MRPRTVGVILLLLQTLALCHAQQRAPSEPGPSYAQVLLPFEANQGQTASPVKFISRGRRYTAFLTAGGLVLSLRPTDAPPILASPGAGPGSSNAIVQLRLVGASTNPEIIGEDPQPGRVNYFIGNDKSKWRTNVPTYRKIRYKNVYPGIDLVYYGNNQRLEYDFAVAPGADPRSIQFEIQGANEIALDSDGNLILKVSNGELHFQSPTVYQESIGSRAPLQGGYVLKSATRVGFQLATFDAGKALVIDPVLVYSTYLGGSGNDQPTGIAVDGSGSVYVTGYTDSADFPLARLGSLPAGSDHVFVAKFDASGTNLVYADYLGGNSQDYGYALALDASNEVYVTGSTASSNFPVVHAYDATYPGSFNAFLTKISADGSSILYSTYLGGSGSDVPSSVALDSFSDVFVAGTTSSTNFPVANAFQSAVSQNQGGQYGTYGFLTEFSPDGSSLLYSTYFGGSSNVALNCGGTPCWPQPTSNIAGLSVDAAGNAYIGGTTNTYNFPVTPGAYLTTDTTQSNSPVGFVSKFASSGALQYSTYFYEPTGFTGIGAITADGTGSAYVTGTTLSNGTFPITSTGICDPAVYGFACSFAFVTKFDPTASSLVYSTFLGANNSASPVAIVLDGNDDAYVLATSSSNSFVAVNNIEAYAGGKDVLLAEIDPVAGSELFATFLGGSADETAVEMAIDSGGNLYLAGATDSTDLPTTQGAFQSQLGGNTDAFIMKIATPSAPSVSLSPDSLQYSSLQVGSTSQPQRVLLRNMGSAALAVSSISVTGDFAESDDCRSGVPPAGSCSLSVTFTPTAAGPRAGSVAIADSAAGAPHTVALSGSGTGGAIVSLTPSNLTFSSTPLGSPSAPQTVTLLNQGNTTLNISNVQITGDYTQNNNCPSALSAGASCTFNVTFTPTAYGARSGSLTLTDNASGNLQTVALSGSGSDFSLAGSPGSVTIKAGSAAPYSLTLTPVGAPFNNIVRLTCSGVPTKATCSLSSASVTPGANTVTVKLTVSTAASSAALTPLRPTHNQFRYAIWLQFSGFGVAGMLWIKSRPWRKKGLVLVLLVLVIMPILFLSGCAGGTGIVSTGGGTPPGTYTITITGASGTLQHSLPLTLIVQ